MTLEGHKLFDCRDCGTNTDDIGEYYMVKDKIWKTALNGSSKGMLCIGCLEDRLGRILTYKDFINYPINNNPNHSDRLKSRLTI